MQDADYIYVNEERVKEFIREQDLEHKHVFNNQCQQRYQIFEYNRL